MAISVLSAGSTLHGLRACASLAAESLGFENSVATDHGHNIRDSVMRGDARADVVLLPADMLAALGDLALEQALLGTVGIGGVVRAGSRAPDISTMAALKAALKEADTVLLTNAPTGDHMIDVIAKFGMHETVAPKLARFATSTKLNLHLATRGDNALGFGPETEIRAGKDVVWIGDVPPEIQIALPYAAAMLSSSQAPEQARAFLRFLKTAQARDAFAKTGVRF